MTPNEKGTKAGGSDPIQDLQENVGADAPDSVKGGFNPQPDPPKIRGFDPQPDPPLWRNQKPGL